MKNIAVIVRRLISVFLVVVSLMLVTYPAALAQEATPFEVGDLVFYEGNNCTQDIVFTYNSEVPANDNCQTPGTACYGDNDEARSLLITGFAKPGTRVKVYDSPTADTTDDYAVIDILPDVPPEGACVGTFEQSVIRPGFRISYIRKDGLDGKISHVTVQP